MTGRQKFLMQLAYKYCPHYIIMNDKDREVFSLRIWISDHYLLSITDTPSLAGTNKFQVRYCEQSKNYYGPSPRCGELDRLFGKKYRKAPAKYAVVDADQILSVVSNLTFTKKTKRNPLQEDATWTFVPRDVWY